MGADYDIDVIEDQVKFFTNVCNDIKNSSGATKTDGKHLCSWSEIEKKLVEKKVPDYVRPRLKDQWIALKNKYKVWLHLVPHLKSNPEGLFRFTPLECVEEMKILFGDSLEDEETYQESEDGATHRTPEEATLPKDASPTKKRSMDFDDQPERILKTVKRSDESSLEECNKVLDGMKKPW